MLQSQDQWKASDRTRHGEAVSDRAQGQEQRSECGDLNPNHGPAADGG